MPYILKAEQLESTINKTKVIDDNSTHEQYPSAKAVKNALDNISPTISIKDVVESSANIDSNLDKDNSVFSYKMVESRDMCIDGSCIKFGDAECTQSSNDLNPDTTLDKSDANYNTNQYVLTQSEDGSFSRLVNQSVSNNIRINVPETFNHNTNYFNFILEKCGSTLSSDKTTGFAFKVTAKARENSTQNRFMAKLHFTDGNGQKWGYVGYQPESEELKKNRVLASYALIKPHVIEKGTVNPVIKASEHYSSRGGDANYIINAWYNDDKCDILYSSCHQSTGPYLPINNTEYSYYVYIPFDNIFSLEHKLRTKEEVITNEITNVTRLYILLANLTSQIEYLEFSDFMYVSDELETEVSSYIQKINVVANNYESAQYGLYEQVLLNSENKVLTESYEISDIGEFSTIFPENVTYDNTLIYNQLPPRTKAFRRVFNKSDDCWVWEYRNYGYVFATKLLTADNNETKPLGTPFIPIYNIPNVFEGTTDQIESNINKVQSINESTQPEVEYPSVKAVRDALKGISIDGIEDIIESQVNKIIDESTSLPKYSQFGRIIQINDPDRAKTLVPKFISGYKTSSAAPTIQAYGRNLCKPTPSSFNQEYTGFGFEYEPETGIFTTIGNTGGSVSVCFSHPVLPFDTSLVLGIKVLEVTGSGTLCLSQIGPQLDNSIYTICAELSAGDTFEKAIIYRTNFDTTNNWLAGFDLSWESEGTIKCQVTLEATPFEDFTFDNFEPYKEPITLNVNNIQLPYDCTTLVFNNGINGIEYSIKGTKVLSNYVNNIPHERYQYKPEDIQSWIRDGSISARCPIGTHLKFDGCDYIFRVIGINQDIPVGTEEGQEPKSLTLQILNEYQMLPFSIHGEDYLDSNVIKFLGPKNITGSSSDDIYAVTSEQTSNDDVEYDESNSINLIDTVYDKLGPVKDYLTVCYKQYHSNDRIEENIDNFDSGKTKVKITPVDTRDGAYILYDDAGNANVTGKITTDGIITSSYKITKVQYYPVDYLLIKDYEAAIFLPGKKNLGAKGDKVENLSDKFKEPSYNYYGTLYYRTDYDSVQASAARIFYNAEGYVQSRVFLNSVEPADKVSTSYENGAVWTDYPRNYLAAITPIITIA